MNSSQYFAVRFTYDPRREVVWRELCGYLQRFIARECRILEIGAGYCHFINNIRAAEKHCLDICEDLPKYAKSNVTAHVASACDLGVFENGRFDVVFCSNFFEHLDREEARITIGEVHRVLTEKGRFIAIQPNFRYCAPLYFDDYTHQTVYSHVGMAQFLESSGFKIHRIVPKFIPFSMNTRLPKIKCLVAAYLRSPVKPFAKQMLIVAEKSEEKRSI